MKKIFPILITGLICVVFITATSLLLFKFMNDTSIENYPFEEYKNKDWPYLDSSLSVERRVDDLISRMTTEEKIGQMALVEKNSIKDINDIFLYGLGALMSGSGGYPKDNSPLGWKKMVQEFMDTSQKSRLGIPILYGVDANHGHSNMIGATIFPHAIGLGAANNPYLVEKIAEATAKEVSSTNINWIFSPSLDVVKDTRWGRTYESFGSSSELVSRLGLAYIKGAESLKDKKIISTAKHYLGSGSMEWNSSINKDFYMDQGETILTENELKQMHLPPFKAAVNEGILSVMVGLNTWEEKKVVFNNHLLTEVLKDELGFKGFAVSDWYGVYQNEPDKYTALVSAINAGVDMVMLPFDYKPFVIYMKKAIESGDITEERLNDAVKRILRAKFSIGIFDSQNNTTDLSVIGSTTHRMLARQAVRESLVLLKNENNVLPISKQTNIIIGGSAADNIGQQSGGWTVEWQGIDGNWIPGSSILDGIKNMITDKSNIEYNLEGNFQTKMADIGIAVVGEKPYAEGWGDNPAPSLSTEDLETINKIKNKSKKIIVIIISGRPLNITPYAKDWDAIVAAWLPGSEGQGVADVIFGDYPFKGKLPILWPLP